MAVESDQDRAVFFGTAEFGEAVAWTVGEGGAVTVNGILVRPASVMEIGAEAGIVMETPRFLCAARDVPGDAGEGDILASGAELWRVRTLLPDGTGMMRAALESVSRIGMLDFSLADNSQYVPVI